MAIVFNPFSHLLVGAFNPFKSKVIIRNVLLDILLLASW